MCELMAIGFERPVYADFSIRAFALRDVENADGWGLAWYPDNSLAVAKEPVTWTGSKLAEFLQSYPHLRSNLYIGHVRRKTVGGAPTRADTHPFAREMGGREYCFAHNGTIITAREQLPSSRFQPIGATDSEQVFCHVLDQLARRGRLLEEERDWRWLHRTFASINELGKFNCLLSDGERLFCHHDADGFKGLWLLEVPANGRRERQHLDDADLHVDIDADAANPGVVVATVPLSDAPGWRRLIPGEMVVIEGGRLAYSGGLSRAAKKV
jgi:predicted glutamine amidotransferase